MAITLSERDLDRVREVQEALLSPRAFSDSGSWRSEVNRRLRALTGADKAMFFVPGQGAWSDELGPSAHVEYEAYYHTFDRGAEISLARGLRVASHAELYGRERFLRGEWHSDFLARHDCFHTLGLTVELSDGQPPWSFLALQRERASKGPFGRRVRVHLALIAPAVRAGVEAVLQGRAWRAALDGALDRVEESWAVCDADGRCLHANTSLRRLLEDEPERASIETSIAGAARAAACPEVGASPHGKAPTARGLYEVSAFRVADAGGGPAVVVRVVPGFRRPLDHEELNERFSLTPREIEVARRIAAGDVNDAIADRLGISPHTVRRHTEAILRKLEIGSRRQVLDRITR